MQQGRPDARDLCLVDLDGQPAGGHRAPRTSEILLHLEIYKAVPEAKAVVHCHPPHATAYAITGRVPPSGIIPEFDVFVGAVALAPYETPGTKKFAETVLPFVKNYNTVLLGNHGIVCWADTVTHAEWYAEVLETYCWTLTIASAARRAGHAGSRRRRRRTCSASRSGSGLPDPRFTPDVCPLAERPDAARRHHADAAAAVRVRARGQRPVRRRRPAAARSDDVDASVRDVTDAVMAALQARGR